MGARERRQRGRAVEAVLHICLLLGLAATWVFGCHAIFGLTDYEVGPGGVGGTGVGGCGGSGATCATADDCPGEDTTCAQRTCVDGRCRVEPAPAGTPCTDSGGQVCDGAGICVECNHEDDCDPGYVCQSGHCVSTACVNGVKDGDETDVDCGGSCAPCANGRACESFSDCESRFCDPTGGAGGAAGAGGSPAGGAGGAGGGGGALGLCAPCRGDADCTAAPNTWCDPSTDGGTCADDFGGGAVCHRAAQCQSGFCPTDSGLCCDTACDGECDSCVGAYTGGTDGTCAVKTGCVTCQDQYGAAAPLHEICEATASECVLRTGLPIPTTCQSLCQAHGGECLDMTDDNPSGSCGVGPQLTCDATDYQSILCTCSHGCGTGPPCVAPQVCSSGTCG